MKASLSAAGYDKATNIMNNAQNDANHVHSVWHDPRNDFGADLLRAHCERGHPHTRAHARQSPADRPPTSRARS
jgi:hypothetical protein